MNDIDYTFRNDSGLTRIFLLIVFSAAALLLFASCSAVTPDETALMQVMAEHQAEASVRAKRNADAALDFFAAQWVKEKFGRQQERFEARVRAESQPTAEWILAQVAARDAFRATVEAEIAAKRKDLEDPNLDVAIELGQGIRDGLTIVTERDRKLAQLRALTGLKASITTESKP